MSGPQALCGEDHALFCDEDSLTIAQSFWKHGQNERACFEFSVRHLPPDRVTLQSLAVRR